MARWEHQLHAERRSSYVGGTGSISCLAIPEDEARAAAERKGPLGFSSAVLPRLEPLPDREDLGECAWTARDLTE